MTDPRPCPTSTATAPSSSTTTATTAIYTLSLHDALPICHADLRGFTDEEILIIANAARYYRKSTRSEEHTSELQSRGQLVCRLLLEKKNQDRAIYSMQFRHYQEVPKTKAEDSVAQVRG